jgi:hypothetical protein
MTVKIEIAPRLIADGKRLYETADTPTRVIAAMMGIAPRTLSDRIAEWGWQRRHYSRAQDSAPPAVAGEPAPAPPPVEPWPQTPPLPFAERLDRVIDGEMAVIERTLKVLGPASSAEAERTTRTLATISRTVQEIVATAQGRMAADDADDDPVPSDICDGGGCGPSAWAAACRTSTPSR